MKETGTSIAMQTPPPIINSVEGCTAGGVARSDDRDQKPPTRKRSAPSRATSVIAYACHEGIRERHRTSPWHVLELDLGFLSMAYSPRTTMTLESFLRNTFRTHVCGLYCQAAFFVRAIVAGSCASAQPPCGVLQSFCLSCRGRAPDAVGQTADATATPV